MPYFLFHLKSRYVGTPSGLLWVVTLPVVIYYAQLFFVSNIQAHIPDLAFMHFLMLGSLSWYFVANTVDSTINSLVSSGDFIKKSPSFLFSQISAVSLENILNFFLAFIAIQLSLYLKHSVFLMDFNYFQLLFSLISLWAAVSLFTRIGAMINVFFRDFKFIVSFSLYVLFFISPILYYPTGREHFIFKLQYFNPLFYFISAIQSSYQNFSGIELIYLNWICVASVFFLAIVYKLLKRRLIYSIYFHI